MTTMKTTLKKSYSELIKLPTFEERFRYLKIPGAVGIKTFDSMRWLNQAFYHSKEWRDFRNYIIARDLGCDLACEDRVIYVVKGDPHKTRILIHHINPITIEDLESHNEIVLDPENVITTQTSTHRAIHYSDESILVTAPIERTPNDTSPWLV